MSRPLGIRCWAPWAALPALLLLAALGLSLWAALTDRLPGDVAVGRWVQSRDPLGQGLGDFFLDVGSTSAAAVTIGVVAGGLLALDWHRGRRPAMAAAALALLAGLGLQAVLKDLVDRPRTSVLFLEPLAAFDSTSFPSGHAMSSWIAGGLVLWACLRLSFPAPGRLWLVARLTAGGWALLLLALTPWVSVTMGLHWPSDALGGVIWGIVALLPGLWLLERLRGAAAR